MVQSGADSSVEAETESDPIWGTLGPPKSKTIPINDEERLEMDLRARKPQKLIVDPNEHPSTQDSIKWA